MQQFFGTKRILARRMNRRAYNDYRGWTLPADEDGTDQGYLVEYLDGGASNHPAHEGYVSWSPKEVFEAAYKPNGAMTFGHAIAALKLGHRVRRAGWNGKGMWLALSQHFPIEVAAEKFWSVHGRNFAAAQGGYATVNPTILMKTATDEILMGWLASQADVLAEDWEILE